MRNVGMIRGPTLTKVIQQIQAPMNETAGTTYHIVSTPTAPSTGRTGTGASRALSAPPWTARIGRCCSTPTSVCPTRWPSTLPPTSSAGRTPAPRAWVSPGERGTAPERERGGGSDLESELSGRESGDLYVSCCIFQVVRRFDMLIWHYRS